MEALQSTNNRKRQSNPAGLSTSSHKALGKGTLDSVLFKGYDSNCEKGKQERMPRTITCKVIVTGRQAPLPNGVSRMGHRPEQAGERDYGEKLSPL
ncbi:hypothetical protein FNAPI_14019 [Fusarium napiforme]|uniref:Uncharacterized protein n=1 Tax=Fusarium napiforme TaxID=42672 RepID=A0A8H5I423_9HYPO|nr:hypothetical protein FNAPI_14019 [Fusarium napiforme]